MPCRSQQSEDDEVANGGAAGAADHGALGQSFYYDNNGYGNEWDEDVSSLPSSRRRVVAVPHLT